MRKKLPKPEGISSKWRAERCGPSEQSPSCVYAFCLTSLAIKFAHLTFVIISQRARFKAVESLRTSKKRTVVVATDVAARGLDIPSVATVVHYDVARAVDTFVHRSGRTAVRFEILALFV